MKIKYWQLRGLGAIAGLALWVWPALAELPRSDTVALVEALRLAAPKTETAQTLYSPWKIKPNNIARWSQLCTGQTLTPDAFTADLTQARQILVCVLEEVLLEEYAISQQNRAIAIRRAAAWWVSGDANLYNQGNVGVYTNRVLSFYEELYANPTDFIHSKDWDYKPFNVLDLNSDIHGHH
ncbi:hypothetical protein [Roseofilum casamattae]|uniref:Heparinase n=1 Tax=Roseofilum casamattae BLCC-M143 TaxID=3022442 RepID=A0ABT7BT81_9CYAN|nr:hypothetical protein [Roseofilum casamattae]MDJ1182384.1 hypothetical protein [Roseofilum casamattae BLCC-M143]